MPGDSKLLSWGTRCDHHKTSISNYQKKAFGEVYRALQLSSCEFNVCISYAHFHFFLYKYHLKENAKALSVCTELTQKVQIVPWRPFSRTNCGMTFQYNSYPVAVFLHVNYTPPIKSLVFVQDFVLSACSGWLDNFLQVTLIKFWLTVRFGA